MPAGRTVRRRYQVRFSSIFIGEPLLFHQTANQTEKTRHDFLPPAKNVRFRELYLPFVRRSLIAITGIDVQLKVDAARTKFS